MTLDEKIGQITGAWLLERDKFKEEVPNGVGSVGPSQELSLAQDVEFRNALQHFLVEETRLGIPAMFHDEGCHGLVKPEASSFPAPIGLACSWDPALAERIYNVVALEMRSRGAQQALAPVVDVARDPGRPGEGRDRARGRDLADGLGADVAHVEVSRTPFRN